MLSAPETLHHPAPAEFITPATLRPLSRAEYDQMVALGMLEDEKVELLHGLIVKMSPQGHPHAWAIRRLNHALVDALGNRAMVGCQVPLAVSDDSEPEPDFSVIEPGEYTDHPRTALLVVEIAESSLRMDRGLKARLYAAASVPEYWVVNVVERAVEVFTEPREGAYRTSSAYRLGHGEPAIALVAFPDVRIALDSFL